MILTLPEMGLSLSATSPIIKRGVPSIHRPSRVSLNPEDFGSACPAVCCAWKCLNDPQCLEFNIHSNKTCDLYHIQPTNFQPSNDCQHFTVYKNMLHPYYNLPYNPSAPFVCSGFLVSYRIRSAMKFPQNVLHYI